MSTTIAVAGKGGTGKTTISGLIIKYLRERGKTPILAVDADANANLNEVLGVEVERTVGSIREEVLEKVGEIPAGIPKDSYLEYRIQESLVEAEGFDLLVMGRPEGPGCYCYANTLLRKYIDALSRNYKYVVIDNEAGMEHLSRRTTQNVQYMLIISDPTIRGIQTAGRIRDLIGELQLRVEKIFLIINRVSSGGLKPILDEEVEEEKLDLLGTVPVDGLVEEFDLRMRPIFELPPDSPAAGAVAEMMRRL